MIRSVHLVLLPVALAAAAGSALVFWLRLDAGRALELRLPVERAQPAPAVGVKPTPDALTAGAGRPSEIAGSWPTFRGADRTNVVRDVKGLGRSWPPDGPQVLWRLTVGEGHAGAAVHRGRVYLVDYDRERTEDAVRCLSLDDGREIWRYGYYAKVKRNHGMSRTVPAVTDRFVVAIGPRCDVHCLDADSGTLLWRMDMVKDFGTTEPPWYTGQCPLIDGDVAILAPGGDPLMLAVELATGRVRWRTPNPGGWGMTHSSVVAMDYRGVRQYVYCTTNGVVSVAASDGRILWTKPDWTIKLANVPTPVVVGEDMLFFSGGYNSGCVMVRLTGGPEAIRTEEVFRLDAPTFGCDQQTPILYDGYIYGVIPGGELACLGLDGRRMWTSGPSHRFGLGPYLIADGLIFILGDQDGTLRLVAADPGGYRELAAKSVLQGHDAWGPMAMAGGRLLLRDATELVCLKVP